jgi:predicted permease
LERAQRVPGVRAVALVDTVPMRNGNNQLGFWTAPPEPPRMQKPLALATSVTPQYFEVMGIPLIRGRLFDERDRANSQHVVVIDEVMARHAFRGDDPLGKVLWTDLVPEPLTVIGVVGHVRHWGLAGDDEAVVRDQFYYPFAQIPDQYVRRWSELMSLVVRSDTDPLAGVSALRHELRGAAGDQVLYETQTLERLARDTLARHRFLLVLFALFAGIALALACVGLYGMLAYVTSQRVREFGVRVALGATARDVLTLVVRQSVRIVAVGAVIGASGAWIAGRVLQRLVVGMRGLDPLTLLVLAVILITPALVATVVPARRAARVDPIAARRQD